MNRTELQRLAIRLEAIRDAVLEQGRGSIQSQLAASLVDVEVKRLLERANSLPNSLTVVR